MSGGKGGSTTSSVQIPAWAEQAAQRNIQRADQISQIGYVPYYGPDVAAFTPMQQASFAGTNAAAQAFGLPTATSSLTGMPAPQNFGGFQAYSSAPMYEASVQQLQQRRPGQYAAMTAPFINPYTGAGPASPFASLITPEASATVDYRVRTGDAAPSDDNQDYSAPSAGGGLSQEQQSAVDAAVAQDRARLEAEGRSPTYIDAYLNQSRFLNTAAARGAELRAGAFPSAGAAGLAGANLPVTSQFDQAAPPPPAVVPYEPIVTAPVPPPPAQITREPAPYDSSPSGLENLSPFELDEIVLGQIESGQFQGPMMPPPTAFQPVVDTTPPGPIFNPSDDNDSYFPGETTGTPLSPADDIASLMPPPSSSRNDNGGGGGGGGGCVIATHAVESGAFTPSMKREAVVWCMHALHGKWWGEAVRRGYRHLGRQKIEQGKAREHYDEFRRYIDFASGKKRNMKGAITFVARTVQFFVVGLVHKEA